MTNANQQLQKEKVLLQKQAREKDTQQAEFNTKAKNVIVNLAENNKKLRQAVAIGMLHVKLHSHIKIMNYWKLLFMVVKAFYRQYHIGKQNLEESELSSKQEALQNTCL